MWQVLFAAAVAGCSGFVAKHCLSPARGPSEAQFSDNATEKDVGEPSNPPALSAPECESGCEGSGDVFRFSSSGSGRDRSKGSRKKHDPRKAAGKKADPGGSNGRKFYICLKKRKTGKNVAPRCGSCSSKESSLFNYGLGMGIMYMMSTGKAEINKLNTAMDETSKVVKELKTELHRRKASQNNQHLSSAKELYGASQGPRGNHHNLRMENADPNDTRMLPFGVAEDGEYASSVLTEEPEREVWDMNQLEAELESELKKLPWSTGNESCETQPYIAETEVPYGMDLGVGNGIPDSCEFNGVRPAELNQKLSRLLIKQQETQITELETELNSTQSKLKEKEADLQALKDCVRRLTAFSISDGVSDDEREAHNGEEWTGNWENSNGLGSDPCESRRPVIGMKRPIDS